MACVPFLLRSLVSNTDPVSRQLLHHPEWCIPLWTHSSDYESPDQRPDLHGEFVYVRPSSTSSRVLTDPHSMQVRTDSTLSSTATLPSSFPRPIVVLEMHSALPRVESLDSWPQVSALRLLYHHL